jgi:hypothetical protein
LTKDLYFLGTWKKTYLEHTKIHMCPQLGISVSKPVGRMEKEILNRKRFLMQMFREKA